MAALVKHSVGVIDIKVNHVETPNEVAARIEDEQDWVNFCVDGSHFPSETHKLRNRFLVTPHLSDVLWP